MITMHKNDTSMPVNSEEDGIGANALRTCGWMSELDIEKAEKKQKKKTKTVIDDIPKI
ncbi:MAG: hypothetical protein JKY50_12515 [Oleispira sp.]|nr:hypothetical protein [Oleispira sp.]